jgi:acyl-coenzyme A thioesterase PaaI-like protein
VTLSLDFIAPVASDRVFFETRLVGEHQGIGHVETRVLGDGGELFALGAVDFALGSYPGDAGPSTTAPVEDPGFLGDEAVEPFGGASVTQALGLAPRGDSLAAPYRANLVGSRTPVAWHGGAIAAASVCAARHLAAEPSARLFQITVNYLRSGLGREAVFSPEIISRTRRALLIETSATQDAGDRLVARSVLRFQRL